MVSIGLNIQLVRFDCSGGVDHRAVGCVVGGMQGRERDHSMHPNCCQDLMLSVFFEAQWWVAVPPCWRCVWPMVSFDSWIIHGSSIAEGFFLIVMVLLQLVES